MSQPAAGDPEQRIEPVHGPEHIRSQRDNPVAAKNVRQLVTQDRVNAIFGPVSAPAGRRMVGVTIPHVASIVGC